MDLVKFNHWWKEGRVNPAFLGQERKVFNEILTFLPKKQIIILKGLRRVGKTIKN